MNADYQNCTWADLAHASWTPRIAARKGSDATVVFTGPQGLVEIRPVPTDRLGRALRAQMEQNFPLQRPVQRRVRIH